MEVLFRSTMFSTAVLGARSVDWVNCCAEGFRNLDEPTLFRRSRISSQKKEFFCIVSDDRKLHFLYRQAEILSTFDQAWQNDSVFSMMVCQNRSQFLPKPVCPSNGFQKICILQFLARKQAIDCLFLDTNFPDHLMASCKKHC